MSYKLKLNVFEGPLDLLLYLIKKNDVDICDIPIAQVTEQYLKYIDMMKMLDLEVVGEFLVMAATLIQIKSRMLLPPDPGQEDEDEEDPRDDLVKRLQEYRIFKEVAEQLKVKEQERQDFFPRQVDEEAKKEFQDDAKEVYFEANLFDLINAFSKALSKFKDQEVYEVEHEEYTVEKKIHYILHSLLKNSAMFLTDFFASSRDKSEVIVTFMAVLELIRLKEIKVVQKRIFSDIEVVRNTDHMVIADDLPEDLQESVQEAQDSQEQESLNSLQAEESAQEEMPSDNIPD